MTLTLSHGPWSITIAKPTDTRPPFQTYYRLNERAQVDTTYQWNWKGQRLSAVSNCTFSFTNLGVRSPITWNPSLAQNAWHNAVHAGKGPGELGYVQIELNARYRWDSEVKEGLVMEDCACFCSSGLSPSPLL